MKKINFGSLANIFARAQIFYTYGLTHNVTFQSGVIGYEIKTDYVHLEKSGKVTLFASPEYPFYFDGNSPKFMVNLWVFNFVIGTPDGQKNPDTGKPLTLECSAIHDALYQAIGHDEVLRKVADRIYREHLHSVGFARATEFYYGLRWLGGVYQHYAVNTRPKFITHNNAPQLTEYQLQQVEVW